MRLSSRLVGGAATLLLALPACAAAQQLPRIPYDKFTLANGLEVILHEDHSTPIVVVNTWYKVGSGDERRGRTGFAHLFEHVMFMGSQHVPVGKFDEWLEAAGVNNNGSTSTDRTNYYEIGPSNALPLMLWLDADRMGWLLPTMDLAKLDLQRDVVKNERRQSYDNAPYGRAYETLLAAQYPSDHPYSWPVIGSMADLSAASIDDVSDFFRRYYAPNNATIVIAGAIQPDSAKAWVTRYFGDIPRNPAALERPRPAPITRRSDTLLVLEDKVQLPRVYYSWPTVAAFHADEAALDLLGSILASGRSSRLQQRLMFREQIVQDVSAYHSTGKLAGTFELVTTLRPGQTPRAVAALLAQELDALLRDGITERELERAKNQHRADLLDRLASILGKAEQLNLYNYFVGEPDYLRQDAARYDAVTRADIQRVANTYLRRGKVVLTVVPEGRSDLALTGADR